MTYCLTLSYACPVCGYSWEDSISYTPALSVGDCQCPNCEEPVSPVVNR